MLSLKFEACEIDIMTPYVRIRSHTKRARAAHWRGDAAEATRGQILNLYPFGGEDLEETVTGQGAPKPVELMKLPILSHTERGDSVYGPFLGAGTTSMVAKRSGESCLDVDSAPRYADVTMRRGEPLTGHMATTAGMAGVSPRWHGYSTRHWTGRAARNEPAAVCAH